MWKTLRRAAFVTEMETTELRDRDDGAFAQVNNLTAPPARLSSTQEVCPGAQIVLLVGLQGATQARLRADDDVVKALAAHGAVKVPRRRCAMTSAATVTNS